MILALHLYKVYGNRPAMSIVEAVVTKDITGFVMSPCAT